MGGNLITANDVQFNADVNQNDGVRLEPGTASTTVQNNVVEGSGPDGIAIGSYLIEDLPPGDYTVTASAAGYEPASQPATVEEDQTTAVDLTLVRTRPGPGPGEGPLRGKGPPAGKGPPEGLGPPNWR